MRLGVIGGLGPMATAYFLELIVAMTDARRDQEHPEIIVMNIPSIPDRTAYILGKSSENPVIPMVTLGKQMKELGATVVATPCITAHFFHEQLQTGIDLPVIHAIRATAATMKNEGISRVGLMATDGTVQSGIFQKEVEAAGMQMVLPSPASQAKVMSIIYDYVKAGIAPDMSLFEDVRRELFESGAEVIVLGCTELSLLKKYNNLGDGILDALEVLAKESVLACGKQVKPEFNTLFTPFNGKE